MVATAVKDNLVPKYSVKQAAEMTGLTLNQVRLWERRYKLVSPQRASNGYRLYSQEDLDILRFARRETEKGVSIQVLADQIREDRPSILRQLKEEKRITPRKVFASDPRQLPNYDLMIHSIASGNPLKFERLLIQAQAGQSFAEALRTVDLPLLARIGEMTTRNDINITSSHLASAIIRRRILAYVQNLGIPQGDRPVIMACAPNDYHELGLLCCLMELTQEKISTLYLGPNVPLQEISFYCDKVEPRALVFSIIAPLKDDEAEELARQLGTFSKRVPVGVGGFEAEKRRELFEAQGVSYFDGVEELMEWDMMA